MKFVCEKEKLLIGLNNVSRTSVGRTPDPILEGILINLKNNTLILTTNDLDIGMEYVINDCYIAEEGKTVVDCRMFVDIIRKLPNSELTIYVNENKLLVIECEGSVYKLSTMNPDNFSTLPTINVEKAIALSQKMFKEMVKKTMFAVSTDENRPIFTGCLFEIKEGKLFVVAVDGFRLALRKTLAVDASDDFTAIIPGKYLSEVIKNISDDDNEIRIGISKNQALFEFDNCKIVTRLLDGEFLNYRNAIPTTWETRVRVNRESLQNCFERISLISSSSIEKEKKYPVKLTVDIGKLTISCTNQTGDAKEEIYLSTEGKNLEIGFNPKYFLDALKSIEDPDVFLDFGTSISPAIIQSVEENGDYIYMILPIRLKD